MEDKNILGLDLGTNSIGWAMVNRSEDENGHEKLRGIIDAGSRIIPMDSEMLGKFSNGGTVKSPASDRTSSRGTRRLYERSHQRRERLHRVLTVLGLLPGHYADSLTRYGKFKNDIECRLPWNKDEDGRPVFIFRRSYDEMLQLFWKFHPEWMRQGMKVPYDWTIYYLRTKALKEAITGEELSWILLNFNQKRGYYQTRDEKQEVDKSRKEEYLALKVTDVVNTHEKQGMNTWFDIVLENGMIYRRTAQEAPDWIGKTIDFIRTTQLNDDGTPKVDKDGKLKSSLRMPKEDDWGLLKIKTQSDIDKSKLTVGAYIFKALLDNPKQKIRGKLVRTIERSFYKDELVKIIESQKQFIPQLRDRSLYEECIDELYPNNEAYRNSISNRDFTYLLVDDILFYQRPLKSKKALIDECPYESHEYKDDDGRTVKKQIKCIARSNPLFQEFRLWQFVDNLRIYEYRKDSNGRHIGDDDVTSRFLPDEESRALLFDFLNDQANIVQDTLLVKYFNIKKPGGKDAEMPYRWNYVQDKKYPCNETRGEILAKLKKEALDTDFLTGEAEHALWHILYSVNDRTELRKALGKYATRYQLDEKFVDVMVKFPPFASDYGSYSAKAIKKLLPLMRKGHHWKQEAIDPSTLERIQKIIDGEIDEGICDRVREKTMNLSSVNDFQGLPLWLACYVVYNRHSEAQNTDRWTSPDDIDRYLHDFKQHSLRNPIVESVVTETLRVVRDIWKTYGRIDEIHVEMGRELKNPADKRKKMMEKALENENTNLRIKAMLTEFLNPEFEIENVHPYSPYQQQLLKIYEDTVLNGVDDVKDEEKDEIADIVRRFAQADISKRPTHSEILRYKLWLDQKYISPYTGQTIPLARLFTSDYEIEHIIPQSRYFDDSLSNKVICETAVNKLKDNSLGYEFIKNHHGEKVELGKGRIVSIQEVESYCSHVQRIYKKNQAKMKKLLMEDVPDDFIARQLNDSRYISRLIKGLLSNIVREEGELESTSKNIIVCTGSITDRLKQEWGINEVWNKLILPRFERMNEKTGTTKFTTVNNSGHIIPDMPLELQKGFSRKRIDHRHHAMDAIIIACVTRDHVNLLSNEAASSKNNINRYQLSRKLRRYEDTTITLNGETRQRSVPKEFKKPWASFVDDVSRTLSQIIVSFKQNLRVITKTSNYSLRFVDGEKKMVRQVKGDSWAIRKPMHKETCHGEINLRQSKPFTLKIAMEMPERIVMSELKDKIREMLALGYKEKQIKAYFEENKDVWPDVNLKKIDMYYFTKETSDRYFASRESIDTSFNEKKIKEKIADTGIRKIMLRHLAKYNGSAENAFSPDGIDDMNQNIVELNDGHGHQPIFKVRVHEKGERFAVGKKGCKSKKFVEAAKGTNLFFIVTEKEVLNKQTNEYEKKRIFRTVPLNEAIVKMKTGEPIDRDATFILSPNDLVYLPTREEIGENVSRIKDYSRLYKFVSSGGTTADFVPCNAASTIYAVKKDLAQSICNKELVQNEFGLGSSKSKNERAITGEMIKESCIPVKVDRLGHIVKIGF